MIVLKFKRNSLKLEKRFDNLKEAFNYINENKIKNFKLIKGGQNAKIN